MRRAFLIGASIGILAFVQGLLAFREHTGSISPFGIWALAWTGLFGIMLWSEPQGWASIAIAGFGLVAFYGVASALVLRSYRRRGTVGAAAVLLVCATIHVALYLWVVRSTPA